MPASGVAGKGPKACRTCARAKARCTRGPGDGSRCARCHRLGRECVSQAPAPPRPRKQPPRSKIAELESRLDELSAHVGPGGVRRGGADSDGGRAAAPTWPESSPVNDGGRLTFSHLFPPPPPPPQQEGGAMGGTGDDDDDQEGLAPDGIASATTTTIGSWSSPWPQPDEAAQLLAEYHATAAALFPFVIVPEAPTPEFRLGRPFLWKAVMMKACVFDGPRQLRLGEELLADISRATLVDGLKTLDVLQGLQLLVGWFNYALKSIQLTNLLFLARSMSLNLCPKGKDAILQAAPSGNLDQLRAYCGTYYLNTLVFTTNKRTDVLMNTSCLESCCATLELASQRPTDQCLVRMVRIQQIAQSIALTMALDSGQPALQLPLMKVVQSFQAQLDAFMAELPPDLKEMPTLKSHVSVAEILLTETAASDQHCGPGGVTPTDRLKLLWTCVGSVRAFWATRFAEQNLESPKFLGLNASDIAYVILTSLKLLALRLPGWDARRVAAEMGLPQLVDSLIEELVVLTARRRGEASVGSACCLSSAATTRRRRSINSGLNIQCPVRDPFDRLLRLVRSVKQLVNLQLDRAAPEDAQGHSTQSSAGDGAGGAVGELDEDFWREMLNDAVWSVNDQSIDLNGL